MSAVVVLTLRASPDGPVDLAGVVPDRIAALAEREIAALPIWMGGRQLPLGEIFAVSGERAASVRVENGAQLLDGLGSGTASGALVVEGDAGRGVGAEMTGGTVEVRGSVGDDAGVAMAGGVLRIHGSAGDRLGSALPGAARGMTGGEILVHGSAGAEAAARARRGLVVVGGDVGERAARAMIAGTLVVLGRTGAAAGRGSRRGSILAAGGIEVPTTYQYACTYRPPHARLTCTYLRRRHGLDIPDRVVTGRYRRWCGDAGDPGKGEILEWVAE